ncbi:MAG: hypothetical protein WCL50_07465 [Spirochaetota bacterium]
MIRKNSAVRGALVALAIVALAGVPAVAATTGSLALTGTAAGVLEITVSGVGTYATLNLSTDVSNVEIASVLEKSNKHGGYSVVVSSAYAIANTSVPKLYSSATTESLAYGLSYGGTAVTFTAGSSKITNSADKTAKLGVTKPMTISFSGADANLAEGTYTDTLTFTTSSP